MSPKHLLDEEALLTGETASFHSQTQRCEKNNVRPGRRSPWACRDGRASPESHRGPGVVTRGAGPRQGPEELHGPDVLGAVTGCPVIALSLGTPAVTVASVRAVTCGCLTLCEWVRLSGSRLSWCHVLNKNLPVFPYRSRHGTCLPSCSPRESQAPLLPAGEPEAGGVHAGTRLRPTRQPAPSLSVFAAAADPRRPSICFLSLLMYSTVFHCKHFHFLGHF